MTYTSIRIVIVRLSMLFVFWVIVSSCSSARSSNADMAIVIPETGGVVPLQASEFRQTVMQIDDAASRFLTITLDSSRKSALLRRYDMAGNRLSEVSIPKFEDGYAGSIDYDLSPDGSRIAYLKHANLLIMNLATQQEVVVLHSVMRKYTRALVRWLSDNRVLLVSELPERDGEKPTRLYRILVVNVATGLVTQLYRDAYLGTAPEPFQLSPRKNRLVFREFAQPFDLYGKFAVLELDSGKVSQFVGDSATTYYGAMSWSPSGGELAYVESYRGDNSPAVKILRIEDQSTRQLLNAPQNQLIYGLIWAGSYIGYYTGEPGKRRDSRFVLVNALTGERARETLNKSRFC